MMNPFARFAPFPEPPALIADYIAARSAEDAVVDGPAPWDIGALTEELIEPLPEWLDAVCRWLNQTYAWQPQYVIPPCWIEHEHLPYEIAAFAFARLDAYDDAGSVVVWHEQYDRFVTRMNNMLGKAGDDCRVGKHDARPARFQLDAWPPRPPAEADEQLSVEPVEELV
ncbi:hypothetical protein C9F11_21110 [Streptomyces sp. YIM 121038]|uniref:hypothetical protein n=1 Tax=Streptomyces sp. YIM 121038 TaxID=2136401 RepID=UPI001110E600|nr:hypothetical protein [Streptomyces sp. YIM 121038]QCX77854.1 hypothetical protein C9F11_21110 [Streptomyces sp. YIM 121038]